MEKCSGAIGLAPLSSRFGTSGNVALGVVRPTLGSFRLFLALSVFFSHVNARPHVFEYVTGLQGVGMFFVVSGFLIGSGIERNYLGRCGAFLLNRFLRIYPLFWVVIALTIAAIHLHGSDVIMGPNKGDWMRVSIRGMSGIDIAKTLTLIWPGATFRLMAVAWSLKVEVLFYLVIAAVYWAFRGRGVVIACYVALGVYLACALSLDMRFENPIPYIPDFVLGVAVSRAATDRAAYALIAAALVLCIFGFCHIDPTMPGHHTLWWPMSSFAEKFAFQTGANVLSYMILLAVFGALIGIGVSPWARRIDDFLGNMTYPFYLCHFAIIATVNEDLAGLQLWVRIAISLGLALACAAALYLTLDRRLVGTRLSIRSAARHPTPGWVPT
jgi:peptidoglycan/LPS O-acetylase OafA/YrhL